MCIQKVFISGNGSEKGQNMEMALLRRIVSITACDIWYQILEGLLAHQGFRAEAGVCPCQVCPGVCGLKCSPVPPKVPAQLCSTSLPALTFQGERLLSPANFTSLPALCLGLSPVLTEGSKKKPQAGEGEAALWEDGERNPCVPWPGLLCLSLQPPLRLAAGPVGCGLAVAERSWWWSLSKPQQGPFL